MLFDLPGYRVASAVDLPAGGREVVIASAAAEAACPSCGVLADRVHQRTRQRLRDVPVAGHVRVMLIRRRFACAEQQCSRRTFTEVTGQVPARARTTARLREKLLTAVVAGRSVAEVAASYGVSWWTVQAVLNAAALLGIDPDQTGSRRLGIDEHRYRSMRYWRDGHGTWRRYEPWMSTIVDVDTGSVLGVVDGRGAGGVSAWLAARPQEWRDRIEVVAIDPSAAFRAAIREQLPHAAVSVDAFHLIKLVNDTLTKVRQRLTRQVKGRHGRGIDPVWTNRRLLLRGGDTLTHAGLARLRATFTADDPTQEIAAAWAVKERLRQLLHGSTLADLGRRRALFTDAVTAAAMPETDKLAATITTWWPAIEVLVITGVKPIKRTGRGYRNPDHYRTRILLANGARTAARTPHPLHRPIPPRNRRLPNQDQLPATPSTMKSR